MIPAETVCPFCSNADRRQIELDGVFYVCGICSRAWGIDRIVVKPSEREQARWRWNDPTEKTKPGGR